MPVLWASAIQSLRPIFSKTTLFQVLRICSKLAKRTSPEDAIRLLLNIEQKPPLTFRVVNNVSYAKLVLPDAAGEMCVKTPEGWQTLRPVLPPRPIVPNPEYQPAIEPFYTTASVWSEAPQIEPHETLEQAPCVLVVGSVMLLAYSTVSGGHRNSKVLAVH